MNPICPICNSETTESEYSKNYRCDSNPLLILNHNELSHFYDENQTIKFFQAKNFHIYIYPKQVFLYSANNTIFANIPKFKLKPSHLDVNILINDIRKRNMFS